MKNKIAIWVEGGAIQGIRSSVDIEVEIIDLDFDDANRDEMDKKWEQYEKELTFAVY